MAAFAITLTILSVLAVSQTCVSLMSNYCVFCFVRSIGVKGIPKISWQINDKLSTIKYSYV